MDSTWKNENIFSAMLPETYVRNITECYKWLFGRPLREFKSPMDHLYHPEPDESPFLSHQDSSVYRGLIGLADWLITIGQPDIHYVTNALSWFAMAPREGHLTAMKRVFGYLKWYPSGKVLIDPEPCNWSTYATQDYDWTKSYPNATEELPPDMLSPKGRPARIMCYVDADHAHDKVTCWFVTGILLFVNGTPIKWISKWQKTVESSTYGSKMVTTCIASKLILEIRYKLCMLGVPVDGPAMLLSNNLSIILSTTIPSSVLKKKHQAICYHCIHKCVAAWVLCFAHIDTKINLVDILTKPLSNDIFLNLAKPVLFRLPTSWQQVEKVPWSSTPYTRVSTMNSSPTPAHDPANMSPLQNTMATEEPLYSSMTESSKQSPPTA